MIQEEFATDPAARGWGAVGVSNLFNWDAASGQLKVTWDSSQPNSYFYRRLGTVLTSRDDFSLSFDLRLEDVRVGVDPARPFTFELAVGFINLAEAQAPGFLRGTGTQAPDLAEFDYFPDSGFGATISPTIVSSSGQFASSFTFPLELTPGDLFHVAMTYRSATRLLSTQMSKNGDAFGPVKDTVLGAGFTDFHVDTVAVCSYSDTGADGSILAHGAVDNLVVTFPDPPLGTIQGAFADHTWTVPIYTQTNWTYTLERSVDLTNWVQIPPALVGMDGNATLRDAATGPMPAVAFYRVRAQRQP